MEKQKSESDRKLIASFTGVDPLDWCRRDNGDLVYLNQAGQKFILTPADLDKFTEKKLAQKAEYHPKSGPKPKPEPEPILEPEPEPVKELTEEQAPYAEQTPEEKSPDKFGEIDAGDL